MGVIVLAHAMGAKTAATSTVRVQNASLYVGAACPDDDLFSTLGGLQNILSELQWNT